MPLSNYTPPAGEPRRSDRGGRFPFAGMQIRPGRLLIAFGALLIVVITTGSAVAVWQQRDKAFDDTQRELSAINVAISEQTARMIEGVDLVLSGLIEQVRQEGVSSSADYRRLESGEAVHAELRERIAALPHLDAVAMIDAAGDLINFSRYWPVPKATVTDRDYFIYLRDHPSAKAYVSAPVRNRGNSTWTIFLARRIDGPDGTFIGLVLGAIALESFEDFYRSIDLGPGSAISLWRRDGVLLARHPRLKGPAETIGRPFPIKALTAVLPYADAGTFRNVAPTDGAARVVSARAVRNYPLIVNVSRTEAAVLSDWRSEAMLTTGGGLVGAIAIALCVWALARRFAAEAVAARAEAASRTKSEFLATMSHELRTPLNAIIGFAEVLRRETFGPLGNARYREYAGDIADSGAHLLAIINDILEIAKAEAGKLDMFDEDVDVSEIVHAALRLVRPRADSGRLSLTATLDPQAILLRADARMLKQMLLNLLANAVKFTPVGGRIEVTASVRAETGLKLAVRDTGCGIAAEHLPLVTRPFFQVDSTLARRHEGTGLGLALVEAMMAKHGGALRLDSRPGQGTTAILEFPPERLLPAPAAAPDLDCRDGVPAQ